jgi:hypothetical protein
MATKELVNMQHPTGGTLTVTITHSDTARNVQGQQLYEVETVNYANTGPAAAWSIWPRKDDPISGNNALQQGVIAANASGAPRVPNNTYYFGPDPLEGLPLLSPVFGFQVSWAS